MDKSSQPKVSIELISRLIDGELSPEQKKQVKLLIEQCPLSARLLQSMKDFTEQFSQAVLESPLPEEVKKSPDCLDQTTLMMLAEGTLAPAKVKQAETHVTSCRFCLQRLIQEVRSHAGMSRGNWKDLPEEVASDPRLGGFKYKKPVPHKPTEKELVIDDTPSASVFDFICDSDQKEKKTRTIENGDFSMVICAQAQKSGLTLEMTVKKNNAPLEQAEVTISDTTSQRKIFRGLSSSSGMLMVRRLHHGRYRMDLPAGGIEVNVIIQS